MILRAKTPAGEVSVHVPGSMLVSDAILCIARQAGVSVADKLELYGPLAQLPAAATLSDAGVRNLDVVTLVATGASV